jgi:hypothetical protein
VKNQNLDSWLQKAYDATGATIINSVVFKLIAYLKYIDVSCQENMNIYIDKYID